jgi:hypothetical protein
VRHLGSPLSRSKPYFVFAGKEFFQQTTNCAPLYEKAFITSVNFIIENKISYFLSIRKDHVTQNSRICLMNQKL